MDITRNQLDYTLRSQRWRSSIQLAKTRERLGADCGSDHEVLIAKFRLKLKKVGKTTRPFRYHLNQEKQPQWDTHTLQLENRPCSLQLVKALHSNEDPVWPNINKKVLKVHPRISIFKEYVHTCIYIYIRKITLNKEEHKIVYTIPMKILHDTTYISTSYYIYSK